jgi:MFS transporter, ACS family, D-galactonate transporter
MKRWRMLAIIGLGFIALTLNWFDVATAFPLIGAEFKVGVGSLSYLISLFVVGYGLAHIPGGLLATAMGLKRTLVAGLVLQGLAALLSGLSYSYLQLEFARAVCGIGGSIFVAVAFGAVVAWFAGSRLTLALGLTGGAAFGSGAALALYIWVYLQNGTGWHTSLVLAAVIELIVAAVTAVWFQIPDGAIALGGVKFERHALAAAVTSRDLWIYGLALLGGYGAYGTTSQLFSIYATTQRHLDPSLSGLLSALVVLAGVPGSVLGGQFADRSHNLRAIVVGSLLACTAGLTLIPYVPTGALWAVGAGIGFILIFGFTAWTSVPARICHIKHEYIGTSVGLMLTLAAVGGFAIPVIFGHLVARTSFTAGWQFLAIVTLAFALAGLLGRNPVPSATTNGTFGNGACPELPGKHGGTAKQA